MQQRQIAHREVGATMKTLPPHNRYPDDRSHYENGKGVDARTLLAAI